MREYLTVRWIALALTLVLTPWLALHYHRWSQDRAAAESVSHALKIAIEQFGPASADYAIKHRQQPRENLDLGLAPSRDPIWQGFERVELFPNGDIHFEFRKRADDANQLSLLVWRTRPRDYIGDEPASCGARDISPTALAWNGLHCDQDVAAPDRNATAEPVQLAGELPPRANTPADEVLAAIGRDDPAELNALRERSYDLCAANPDGVLPLAAAVRGNQAKALPLLIGASCNLNEVEPSSARTPLMLAATARDVELTRQLLAAGADPKVSDAQGDSAWFLVGTDGDELSVQIRQMLLVKGADVNALAADQGTLLMRAAAAGNLRLAEWLILQGAQLDLQDSAGRSALMHAALAPNGETVLQLLINRRAQLNLKDVRGQTALALAQTITEPGRQSRMLRTLQAAGGKT